MIKNIKILFFQLLFITNNSYSFAQNGFHYFEVNGLWGVSYNGETCLLPRFEEISGVPELEKRFYRDIDESNYNKIFIPKDNYLKYYRVGNGYVDKEFYDCTFFYRENSKYGISNIWEIITQPFCDEIRFLHKSDPEANKYGGEPLIFGLFLYREGGKWGICDIEGNRLVKPIFDSYPYVFDSYGSLSSDMYIGPKKKSYYKKHPLIYNNTFFGGKEDGEFVTVDIMGNYYDIREPQTLVKMSKKDIKEGNVLSDQILEIQKRRYDNLYAHTLIIEEKGQCPYKIYLGERDGKTVELKGDSVVLDGKPCIVTDFGFISMPLIYSSLEERLSRNPSDVYAIAQKLENEYWSKYRKYSRNDIEDQVKLATLCKQQVDTYLNILQNYNIQDKNTYNYIYFYFMESVERAQNAHYRELYLQKKEERLNSLLNGLSSLANSLAATANVLSEKKYNIPVNNIAPTYSYTPSSNINQTEVTNQYDKKTFISSPTKNNNLEEQYKQWEERAMMNYNSLTNIGTQVKKKGKDMEGSTGQGMSPSNYVKMKNLLREAQREMRRIRSEAGKQGIIINKSNYEDISVSY